MIRRRGFTLVEVLIAIFIIVILIAMLLPAVQSAREAARRTQCANNLKQVGLAIVQYGDAHKQWLPATIRTIRDAKGLPAKYGAHWDSGVAGHQCFGVMTTILPFAEQQSLHDSFDYDKGAMDPVNQPGIGTVIKTFQCPSTEGYPRRKRGLAPDRKLAEIDLAATDYFATWMAAVIDWPQHSPWQGEIEVRYYENASQGWEFFDEFRPTSLVMVEDGLSNTALFVEKAGRPTTYSPGWGLEPHDFYCAGCGLGWAIGNVMWSSGAPINRDNSYTRFSFHPGGAHHVLCDGSVKFLDESVHLFVLQAYDSRAGGEPIDQLQALLQ